MGSASVIAQNGFRAKQNAERLHGASPTSLRTMYSPRCYRVSHTMTNKKTKQANKHVVPQKPRETPPNKGGRPTKPAKVVGAKAPTFGNKNVSIPRFVLAQTDPFNQNSFDAKVPDTNTASSCTAFSRNDYSIGTGATLGAGRVFRPGLYKNSVSLTPASQTGWTYDGTFTGATDASNVSSVASTFASYRTVAFGISISTRLSYTEAKGIVHIALIPDMLNNTTWDFPVNTSQIGYSFFHKKITLAELLDEPVTVTSKFTDMTAFRYLDANVSDIGSYTHANPSSGWCSILVWVEGGPASATVLDIEQITHIEALPPATNGSGGIIVPSAATPHSPATLAAVSYMNEHISPVQHQHSDDRSKEVNWARIWKTGVDIANGVGKAAELALDFVAIL